MKKLYLKSALLLVLTLLLGITSCKKDEFKNLSLSFSTSKVELDEGGYVSLKKYLVIQPSNLDTITVAWSSSDESVATVSKKGSVEGVSIGNAVITASAHGKSATIKVNVTPLPIEDVTVPEKVDDIWVNVPYKLDGVGLTPSGASLKRINWSDESGKLTFEYNEEENAWYVTATEAGTYNVKATADDHEAESTFTVKIKTIDSITLSETSLSLLSTGTESRTATLTYKIQPEDASYQEVEWSATPSGIINLDKGKITTIDGKEGTVTVTLKHKAKATGDKDIEATCKVAVTQTTPVESFTLSESDVTLNIGESITVKVKNVKPASGDASKIIWGVGDPSLLDLSTTKGSSCTLTGIGTHGQLGYSTTVTVTAPNGYSQRLKVHVEKVPAEVVWDNMPEEIIFFGNKTYLLPAARVNADATIKDITYTLYEGRAGTQKSTDIRIIPKSLATLEATTPNFDDIKEYILVAKCDNSMRSVYITLVSSSYLKNNLRLNDRNTKIYGTYKKKFVVNDMYIDRENLVLRDSIFFSPEKSTYYTLDSEEHYSPDKKYHSLNYIFDDISYPSDEREAVKFTATLYDFNRNNVQNATFTVNIRNSFLGYYYKKYNKDSSTPSKTGTMKAGETISINYSYTGYNYWMPLVKFYQIYYTDDNKTKGYQDDDAEVGGYSVPSSATRTVTKSIRTGETLYVKYKY